MRFGVLVLTEYQLMNIIRFVYFNNEKSRESTDLFISESIRNVDRKIEILSKSGVFNEIIKVKQFKYLANPLKRKVKSLLYTLNKSSFIKFLYKDYTQQFDTLLIPCSLLTCELFRRYYYHKSLCYYEDGFGSYFGNIKVTTQTNARRVFNKLFKCDEQIDALYLNLPSFSESNVAKQLRKINGDINDSYILFLKSVFCNDNFQSAYEKYHYIYLRQPIQLFGEKAVAVDISIINKLGKLLDNRFIIREHPLNINDVYDDKFSNITIDLKSNMWELECLSIKEKCVLIGMFSTAQISPKILFGYEPFVVFLFNLFPLDEHLKMNEQKTVERFRNLYLNKNRIFVPNNMDELEEIIQKI